MPRPHHWSLLWLLATLVLASGQTLSAVVVDVAMTVTIADPGGQPLMTAARTADRDHDGRIDAVVIDFSRQVTITDPGGAGDGIACFTLGGGRVLAPGDYAGASLAQVTLNVVPGSTPDTDATFDITYSTGTSATVIASSSFNPMGDAHRIDAVDGAEPVLLTAQTVDGVGDGRAHALLLRFSEPLALGTLRPQDFTVTGIRVGGITGNYGGQVAAPGSCYATLVAAGLLGDAAPSVAYAPGTLVDLASVPAIARSVIATDRVAPVVSQVAPPSGSFVADTQLGYTLNERLTSGTIRWTRVAGAADPAVHTAVLIGAELAAGSHGPGALANAPRLVPGAVYDLSITMTDVAGNSAAAIISSGTTFFTRATWPRIVSEAELVVAAGDAWTYDVVTDIRGLRADPRSHRLVATPVRLVYTLGTGAPAGMTIVPTGDTTARVNWPHVTPGGSHVRVRVVVVDPVSGGGDYQEVLIDVVPVPSGGG